MPDNGKLEALRKREAEIRAKIAEEETKRRKRDEKEKERLKLMIGDAVLAGADSKPDMRAKIVALLESRIAAPKDREFLKAKGWL